MNVLDFEKLVRNERTAKHYVPTRCSMVAGLRCPSCSGDKLYEVENGKRRRCPGCGHTFNPFAGRYLNNVKLSANEWLWVVKLFELETSATVIASETGMSYPTALKAIDTIRSAIAQGGGPRRLRGADPVPAARRAKRQRRIRRNGAGRRKRDTLSPRHGRRLSHIDGEISGIQPSRLPGSEDRRRRSRLELPEAQGVLQREGVLAVRERTVRQVPRHSARQAPRLPRRDELPVAEPGNAALRSHPRTSLPLCARRNVPETRARGTARELIRPDRIRL